MLPIVTEEQRKQLKKWLETSPEPLVQKRFIEITQKQPVLARVLETFAEILPTEDLQIQAGVIFTLIYQLLEMALKEQQECGSLTPPTVLFGKPETKLFGSN